MMYKVISNTFTLKKAGQPEHSGDLPAFNIQQDLTLSVMVFFHSS